LALFFPAVSIADCIAITEAKKHIGETRCVSGKVLRVKEGNRGVTFLDFCEDYEVCPFTVVVFPSDLKHVGDVRELQGKMVKIHGHVKEYDGRAEIVLERAGQLAGDAGRIPALPRNYDVEKKGRYSAGRFSHPKTARKTKKRNKKPSQTEESYDTTAPTE
jgi:ssDNA-binding Zn-finger/Zn-ribbon topoisomerase 1